LIVGKATDVVFQDFRVDRALSPTENWRRASAGVLAAPFHLLRFLL